MQSTQRSVERLNIIIDHFHAERSPLPKLAQWDKLAPAEAQEEAMLISMAAALASLGPGRGELDYAFKARLRARMGNAPDVGTDLAR